ncbi:MAG: hypothetical protein ACYC0Z_13015 [Acidobacteriaceae bacterium]
MNWIKSMFSDPSGMADDARVAAFLVILSFVGNSAFALYKGQPWNPQEYGLGAGALAAGIGVWFGQRGKM